MDGIRQRAIAGIAATLAAVASGMAAGQPAGAGGADPLTPARDRYEPGQTVTMIGYGDAGASVEALPAVHAFLRVDPMAAHAERDPIATPPFVDPSDLPVGHVVVEDSPSPDDPHSWRPHRMSLTFELPPDLAPGAYEVLVCADPCTTSPGTFWPDAVHVGVDADHPVVRDWPLSEPGIRWLEDDALILTPWGQQVTAAEVRAGTVAEPPAALVPAAPPPTVAALDQPTAPRSPRTAAPVTATTNDGRAGAWWVAAEVAALVLGGVGAMAWDGRRRRRRGSALSSSRLVVRAGGTPVPPSDGTETRSAEAPDNATDRVRDTGDIPAPIRL